MEILARFPVGEKLEEVTVRLHWVVPCLCRDGSLSQFTVVHDSGQIGRIFLATDTSLCFVKDAAVRRERCKALLNDGSEMTTNLTAVASKVEKKRRTPLPSATDNGGPRERMRSERRTLLRVLREVSCVNSIFGRCLSTDCASRSCNGESCSRFQAPRAIHPRPWQRHEEREEQPVWQTCERWGWHLF